MNRLPRWMRQNLPFGLLAMLGLVAAVEHFVAREHDGRFTTIGTASWTYSGRAAAHKVRDSKILCFGDSQVKFGIVPRVLEQRLGRPVFNLAVHGGGPQTSYFLLRRALASGARPEAVVADFPLETLLADHAHTRIAEFPEVASLRDCLELAWTARDASLFAAAVVADALPSYQDRYNIRACVLAALRGEGSPLPQQLPVYWRNWNRNLGAHVMPPNPAYQGAVDDPLYQPLFLKPWACTPVNAAYVRRFFALAAQHHIPAYWIIQPICPNGQAIREALGTDAQYAAFVRTVQAEYPELAVIDARHAGYGNDVFRDPVHLDRNGASTLSADVAAILAQGLGRRATRERWVELPRYRTMAAGAAMEDLEQSLAFLYASGGTRR